MKHSILALCIAGFSLVLNETTAQDNKGKDNTEYKKDKEVNTRQETPVKIIQFIPGSWELEQVVRAGKDVAQSDTVAERQSIEFNREGRYMSYSGNETIDSGAYRLNEDHAILYLESETDDKTQEWNVWFGEDGTMTLKLREGVAHGERFSYVYRRTSNAARE